MACNNNVPLWAQARGATRRKISSRRTSGSVSTSPASLSFSRKTPRSARLPLVAQPHLAAAEQPREVQPTKRALKALRSQLPHLKPLEKTELHYCLARST